ncbi:unnamed protein product [Cylindrotheca closterium]|uniref:Reverse transcriptase Ty1/copia-type domain-containing protein n=1 Tax=Cylindrotheca closterium TaxID=2856 RepID=A0AAD2FBM7_9STRA|nr:unnamed protein product [Cylindrotheca closterium]
MIGVGLCPRHTPVKRISNCVVGLDPVLTLADLCVLHVPLLSPEKSGIDPSGAYKADEKYIRPLHTNANTPHFERYEDDEMLQHEEPFEEAQSEEDDQVEFDKYVDVKIRKNENGIDKFGVVRGRKRRADGLMVGSYHEKPVLDTSIYEVEWHDGETESYRANKVIEAMMMNVDDDGNSILHAKEFIDPRTDGTQVHADDGFVMVKNMKVPQRTTKGWDLCAQIHGDASVVTRESICIGFLLALLNGLDILSADIAGAYLNAPCAEKIYTVLGPKFGDLEGRTAVVEKALYGFKSSGFSWRSTLSKTLRQEMEFKQCRGDMDACRKPALKSNGKKYYEYISFYTDDLMAVSENPRALLERLGTHYMLKPNSLQHSLVQQFQNVLLILVILENAGQLVQLTICLKRYVSLSLESHIKNTT